MDIKPYLEDDEIARAKMCISNIEDKLNAIKSEVYNTAHPYKKYLDEKLQSIIFDTKCLDSMINK